MLGYRSQWGDEMAAREYLMDSASDLGREQVDCLSPLLDAATRTVIERAGIGPGSRCLDVGAGSGSIARWLAEKGGRVTALDITTDQIIGSAGVNVLRHDINDGVPEGGPFDLIHARLVLIHLPRRREILRDLVEALAPGGRLVIGEYGARLPYLRAAGDEEDRRVFELIQHVGHRIIGVGAGQSYEWSHEVGGEMEALGLAEVEATEYSSTMSGGDIGSRYLRTLALQIAAPLFAAGVSEDELRRYDELLADPRLRGWLYQFVCTMGRKAS